MLGVVLKLLLPYAPTVVGWVMGLFGISPVGGDERDKERAAGERLGKAEYSAEAGNNELNRAQRAVDAGRAAGDTDAIRLRDGHSGDRPFDPDGLS